MTELKFSGKLLIGRFITRENRFLALVKINGTPTKVYVPNSGRMEELLVKDQAVLLAHRPKPGRKTEYDLIAVDYQNNYVVIDSRIPNIIFAKAVKNKDLKEFKDCKLVKKEYSYGDSRLDFLLEEETDYLIETKSVTLVESGIAKFPDAPTKRGRRHLNELIAGVEAGLKAAVVFIIQRSDVTSFTPNWKQDEAFAKTLKKADAKGVNIYAYKCSVSKEGIILINKVAVDLSIS